MRRVCIQLVTALFFAALFSLTLRATTIPLTGAGRSATAVASVSLAFTASAQDTTAQTTYTTAALAIGTASAGRCVVAQFGARANAGRTVTSVTIGGVSATLIATATDNSAGADISTIWAAVVPTGTTAVFAITYSAAMLRMGMGAWAMTGMAACTTPSDTQTSTTVVANSTTITLNVPANGAALAGDFSSVAAGSGATWTGLTEDFDQDVDGNGSSGASGTTLISLPTLAAVVTAASTSTRQPLAGATWGP